MRDFPSIALFALLVSLAYTGLAQVLPQREGHPPPRLEWFPAPDVGPEQLSEIGWGVFGSMCVQCHTIGGTGGRGPDLADIGALAKTRAEERSQQTGREYADVDYLLESLCRSDVYLVEGFEDTMPSQIRALDGGQLLAVTAFMQDIGGTATVFGGDADLLARSGCPTTARGPADSSAGGGVASGAPVGGPGRVFEQFGCVNCHEIDRAGDRQGPSLFDAGRRLDRGEIYEAILDPDARVAEPFAGELMRGQLDAAEFYARMTREDYEALVDWLAEKKG